MNICISKISQNIYSMNQSLFLDTMNFLSWFCINQNVDIWSIHIEKQKHNILQYTYNNDFICSFHPQSVRCNKANLKLLIVGREIGWGNQFSDFLLSLANILFSQNSQYRGYKAQPALKCVTGMMNDVCIFGV